MDYLAQLLMDPNQERSITIKTKPGKPKESPEAPLDSSSANLPGPVLEMMGLGGGGGQGLAPAIGPEEPQAEPDMNEMLAMLLGQGMTQPTGAVDPGGFGGQVPMDLPTMNPYGGA